jgi:hypothetical protein
MIEQDMPKHRELVDHGEGIRVRRVVDSRMQRCDLESGTSSQDTDCSQRIHTEGSGVRTLIPAAREIEEHSQKADVQSLRGEVSD